MSSACTRVLTIGSKGMAQTYGCLKARDVTLTPESIRVNTEAC